MSYQFYITSTAEHDIMRAADCIEFTLKNPDAVDNLLDAATERINNYLVFYTIDEEKQTVIIVRFLYQKSNWTSILRQGFPLV